MRSTACVVSLLLLPVSSALGQTYDMTIHLTGGATVTIPLDDIQRVVFADLGTGAGDPDIPAAPGEFRLLANHPNPFSPSTTIEYETPGAADVAVRIFDVRGALVVELQHATLPAGRHQVVWDGRDGQGARVASGVYLCAVESGGRSVSRQLLVLR